MVKCGENVDATELIIIYIGVQMPKKHTVLALGIDFWICCGAQLVCRYDTDSQYLRSLKYICLSKLHLWSHRPQRNVR